MTKHFLEPGWFEYDGQGTVGDETDSTWTPPDQPMGSHAYGTTTNEERAGETFDQRIRHMNPDVFDQDIEEPQEQIGRLVDPSDSEVDLTDEESNAVAYDYGVDDGEMSAEEEAIHLTGAPPTHSNDGYIQQ